LPRIKILTGDVIEQLKTLPDSVINCVVTSTGARSMKIMPLAICAALLSSATHAEWKNVAQEWEPYGLTPSQHSWFGSVHNKQNVPCCNIADGHPTEQRRGPDGDYQVPDPRSAHKGEWLDIPREALTKPPNNPVGVAIVWYVIRLEGQSGENVFVRCFVPEAES
jgi:hypothetical protein